MTSEQITATDARRLGKAVKKAAKQSAKKAAAIAYGLPWLKLARKQAKKAARVVYQRQQFGGDGGTVTHKRPGPFLGAEKPLPPIKPKKASGE
jgi:hypothetical protein